MHPQNAFPPLPRCQTRHCLPVDAPRTELCALFSFNQTSGRGTGTPSQRDQDLQKENAKLASENLQLRFQLEQQSLDNNQIPRLKVRINPELLRVRESARALTPRATTPERNVLWSGDKDASLFSQDEVADLKEMFSIVKREKAELEKKLAHIRGVS